ncbi:MAG: sulfur carrier protein ThiS [Actinobacteria bacterium]|nr:sulfur carrier protein ThiS [Actinomycetota bacterium]
MEVVKISINGATMQIIKDSSVADLVSQLELPNAGVALAINGSVIPKSTWASVILADKDRIELISIAQGG